ncbi:MAG TPA: hypothetical protein VJL29_05455 [Thermoguttaceae bacterium]|nr:hypothetical protein [Thermoguttaceae bacterium]
MRQQRILMIVGGLLISGASACASGLSEEKGKPISIKGPFKPSGSVSLADLQIPKTARAFQPLHMGFDDALQDVDRAYIIFTFKGDEDPQRILIVEAVARDHRGKAIARMRESFRDPRIEAKKPQPLGFKMDPTADIMLSLPKGLLFEKVASIDLYVTEERRQLEPTKPSVRRPSEGNQTPITIKGPFQQFGSVSLENLRVPKAASAFQPTRMKLEGSLQDVDRAFIIFTFKGDEDPKRVLVVEAIARDRRGESVARTMATFRDPRIVAKLPGPLGSKVYPTAVILLEFPKGLLLGNVHSIDLYVKEGRQRPTNSK